MNWLLSDFHWLAAIGLWCLFALFAYSLCAIAKTEPPRVDEVDQRRETHRRIRIQEAEARSRFYRETDR